MSAVACHVAFEQTLIAALLVGLFAAVAVAAVALAHFRILNRKINRLMAAQRLDPTEDDRLAPVWFQKMGAL